MGNVSSQSFLRIPLLTWFLSLWCQINRHTTVRPYCLWDMNSNKERLKTKSIIRLWKKSSIPKKSKLLILSTNLACLNRKRTKKKICFRISKVHSTGGNKLRRFNMTSLTTIMQVKPIFSRNQVSTYQVWSLRMINSKSKMIIRYRLSWIQDKKKI